MVDQKELNAPGASLVLSIVVLASVAYKVPLLSELLVYDRRTILNGELWRTVVAGTGIKIIFETEQQASRFSRRREASLSVSFHRPTFQASPWRWHRQPGIAAATPHPPFVGLASGTHRAFRNSRHRRNYFPPGDSVDLTNSIVPISMYIMTTKRDDILDAAKILLWEKGYDATSPRAIQDLSNAGQGSFYHHFKSKKDLAATTLETVVDERIADFDALFGDSGPVIERIERFLLAPRDELKGCRIGRMVWDSAIGENELRRPIMRYFRHVESRIVAALEEATASGEVRAIVPPEHIAAMVSASIQGALTLGRAMQDPKWYARTIQGAVSFINSALKPSG